MTTVREHPSDLVRDQYVMEVAGRTNIEPARLRLLLEGRRPPPPATRRIRLEGPEVEALRLAVHRPEEVADTLHEALFSDPVVRAGYRALCASTTLAQAIDVAEPEPAAMLQRMAVEDTDASADDVLARLAEEAGKRAVVELEAEARRTGALTEEVGWLKLTLAELREGPPGVDATTRLVRWIVDRFEVGA